MKRKISISYFAISILLFVFSIFCNREYFYHLTYGSLILYQVKQVLSTLVLFMMGYLFLKSIQQFFNNRWVVLLSMPCGCALWVFVGQALFLTNITYMMHRVFIVCGLIIIGSFTVRKIKQNPIVDGMIPSMNSILFVLGTALLVSTGFNYINMNYDSYIYFVDYGKMMAYAGDYREWNTSNGFVITNIGQFLPILNSYMAFWGIEYGLPLQSFLAGNMLAIFAYSVYEIYSDLPGKKRWGYTILFTAAFLSCTCVVVYANWMLSNAFIMYYLTIAVILGDKPDFRSSIDYTIVLSGCALAITLLRKDGIIIVCFLFVCYCCNRVMERKMLILTLFPSVFFYFWYIGYVRLFLNAQALTARGTSILNNKFVLMTVGVVLITCVYILFIHTLFEKWFKHHLIKTILGMMAIVMLCAVIAKPIESFDHIDAVLRVLSSQAYGFSIIIFLLLLSISFSGGMKMDYGLLVIVGYCILTFLIYWNKGNSEQGIDNSGMRMFVQMVPLIFYFAAEKMHGLLKADRINNDKIV